MKVTVGVETLRGIENLKEVEAGMEETDRKEVFRTLVDLQDRGCQFEDSHDQAAARYGITRTELRRIEREGIDKQWPPL